jgi:hypothetical protein
VISLSTICGLYRVTVRSTYCTGAGAGATKHGAPQETISLQLALRRPCASLVLGMLTSIARKTTGPTTHRFM